MSGFVASFNHFVILLLDQLLRLDPILISFHCFVDLGLGLFDLANLDFILFPPALHITDILDNRALNLMKQLQCRLALNFSAPDLVGDMDFLNLIAECVQ